MLDVVLSSDSQEDPGQASFLDRREMLVVLIFCLTLTDNLIWYLFTSSLSLVCGTGTMHNGGAHGHFDFLTQCINFYSHSLVFPAILPPLIIYNLFIWWYRWVSGEEYYHFLYFAFSVAQTVQKLQVFCFFWSVNGFRESHKTLQQ